MRQKKTLKQLLANSLPMLLLCIVMFATQSVKAQSCILPLGQDTPWQMKYFIQDGDAEPAEDANGNTWLDFGYDDSSWATLTGPMGTTGNEQFTPNYTITAEYTCFFLRRTFTIDGEIASTYRFHFHNNDDLKVFLNGELIINNGDNIFYIDGAAFVQGTNILSIYYKAMGNPNYLDYELIENVDNVIQEDGTFTSLLPSGLRMAFKIIDEGKKTVQVGTGNAPAIYIQTEGELSIPESVNGYSVVNIGENAFSGCSKITSVVIPEGVTELGTRAFSQCDNLQTVSLPNTLTDIGGVIFEECGLLDNVIIPNSLTYIGYGMFENCRSLSHIEIPNTVTSIGVYAFENCDNLKTITIPNSVTDIGGMSFRCGLETVYSYIEKPFEIEYGTFYGWGDHTDATLYVPAGTIDLYRNTAGWDQFWKIVEIGTVASEPADGDIQPDGTFTWTISSGVRMTFKVIDSTNKYVQVGNGSTPCIDTGISGELSIPATVNGYTVTTVGEKAFRTCGQLTEISLPTTINTILDGAFYCCGSLLSMSIPKGVTALNFETFTYCDNLKEVTIPESVTSIGGSAFYSCGSLTSISLPQNLVSIGGFAFCGCTGLEDITLPASITSIGKEAFRDCFNLETILSYIENPFSVNNICLVGTETPMERYQAVELRVPKGTKGLYQQTDGWSDFQNIVEMVSDADAPIDFADAEVKRICVENWDDNKDGKLSYGEAAAVTDLGLVFKSNSTITSFEELAYFTGLTEIPDESFRLCTSLQSVVLPENLQSIGLRAFMECKLQSIIISNNVQTIAHAAFADCGLSTISIPASVTSIGNSIFAGNSQLSTIVVDTNNPVYDSRNGCNAIINTSRNELIQGCVSTIIPSEIKSISDGAFELMNIEHINLPQGLERIGFNAFYGCPLREIVFPEGLTYIGRYSFNGCDNLTEFHVPQSVQFVDGSAIAGCGGITSISVADGNANYSSAAGTNAITNKDGTVLVMGSNNTIIPSTVKSIADDSFRGRWNLAAIEIPESVESIGGYAFCECSSLTSIVIPKNVTEINEYAFANCTKLRSVTLMRATPISITDRTFDYTSETTLYVPYGSKADYETANVWKEFKEIVEVKPDNFLYANEATIRLGDKKTIALQLDNTESLIAADFRLQLPAGFSIEKNGNGDFITEIVSARRVNHTLAVADEGNGLYHFLSYSNPIRAYKGNAGDFITLSIVSDGSMQEGTYTATLKSIIFSDENEQKLTFTDSSFEISVIDYTPGDADGDNHLDVVDVVKVVSHIMGRNPSNFNFIAVDLDGNGKVNVMDLVNLIDLIMSTPQQSSAISAQGQMGTLELSKSDDETIAMNVPFANQHVAAQFMVSLSDGTVLQDVVTDKAHRSQFTRIADGRYKVMVFSNNNATFSSDSPIKLQLNGSGNVKVEETVFVDTDEEAVAFEATTLGTTGIATVGTSFAKPSDIYTVDGKLVKKDATSTQGIAKGVYIVNNQKVIVK